MSPARFFNCVCLVVVAFVPSVPQDANAAEIYEVKFDTKPPQTVRSVDDPPSPYVAPALQLMMTENIRLVGLGKENVAIFEADDSAVQASLISESTVRGIAKVSEVKSKTVEIFVQYEKDDRKSVRKKIESLKLKIVEDYEPGSFFVVRSGSRGLLPEQVRGLRDVEGVEVLEPNFVQSIPAPKSGGVPDTNPKSDSPAGKSGGGVSLQSVTPNDPAWPLWGMEFLNCSSAWECGTDSKKVVAVIDTGVDLDHPDLVNNLWTGNGGIHGYDFANDDDNPDDDNGHGTHCAGTIGAEGNNGRGVVGVAWNVEIMAMKFLTGSGSGSTYNAVRCIDWAVANDADILSNSWGGGGYSSVLKRAIDRAEAKGVLFVAAAGNEAVDNDAQPHYPSSYDNDSIISVASHWRGGAQSGFSNYGANSVDLAAPGSNINSTWPGGGLRTISGTSMATPHVAGAIALAWSRAEHENKDWRAIKDLVKSMTVADPNWAGKAAWGGTLRLDTLSSCDENTDAVQKLVIDLPDSLRAEVSQSGTTLEVKLMPSGNPRSASSALREAATLEEYPTID